MLAADSQGSPSFWQTYETGQEKLKGRSGVWRLEDYSLRWGAGLVRSWRMVRVQEHYMWGHHLYLTSLELVSFKRDCLFLASPVTRGKGEGSVSDSALANLYFNSIWIEAGSQKYLVQLLMHKRVFIFTENWFKRYQLTSALGEDLFLCIL